ncbi:MAG: TDP-N-acetylfucosamine:lipid II N-acetylfucosaminyltransferase [Balneola sp.]
MKKIRILHSFPSNNSVFKKYCELTFSAENLTNNYVDSLKNATNINTDFDIIIVHYLRDEDVFFLNNESIEIPKILFAWGADLFNLGKFYNKFLLNKTKKLRTKHDFNNSFYTIIKKISHTAFPSLLDLRKSTKARIKVLNEFDFIVPVMPGDFELLKKYYPTRAKLHHLNYVNPLIVKDVYEFTIGENILLGNSATYTNNHIEAIDLLGKIDLKDRQIIIPLSYGETDLADFVTKYSKAKLGEKKITILREFLPFEEYNKIMNSCGILIMNHLRQQAVGNIMQALLQGAHIYLNSESTVYDFLKDHNFNVSKLNDLKSLSTLTKEEIEHNRKLTKEVFGLKRQQNRIKLLLDQAFKN